MKFRITFKSVSAEELPEIVDAFAGSAGEVVVSSASTMRKYEVTTTWSEDLRFQAMAMHQLNEWLTKPDPLPEGDS
jgi:hypothetical protein